MRWRHVHGGWGVGHWIFAVLALAIMATAVVALLMLAVRRPAAHAAPHPDPRLAPPAPPTVDAERILAERFARGEIDEAEFLSKRNALRSPS